MISQPTLKKFGRAFMISGNINLVNDVLKVMHGSGHKIDQVNNQPTKNCNLKFFRKILISVVLFSVSV